MPKTPVGWWLGLLVLLSGCGGTGQPVGGPAGGEPSGAAAINIAANAANEANEGDGRIEALLAGKDEDDEKAVPAEEFFAKVGQEYMIWKGEVEWFKKLAAEAKAAGSPAVYAVVGEAFGTGRQVCGEFVIVMPADPAARSKVIEAYNNFWKTDWDQLEPEEREELQHEFVSDQGQKYLSLMYDP